jgi:sugar transferase (PEP-CTERM system associated)
MWRYFALRKLGAILLEMFLLACCGLAGYFFRLIEFPSDPLEFFYIFSKALVIAVIFQISLHLNDVYRFRGHRLSVKFIWLLLRAVVFAVLAACVIFYALPVLTIGRGVFALNLILASIFTFCWHPMFRFYLHVRQPQTNLLALGSSNLAIITVKEIQNHPELGIKIIGFVTDDDEIPGVDAKVVGGYDDFSDLVLKHAVNHIIVGLADSREKLPVDDLLDFKTKGILIEDVAAFYERVAGKIPIESLKPSWLVFNNGFNISKSVFLQKRILSILISTGLLILTSPILLLAMILIKLNSKGPVFYKQDRVGKNGQVFTLVKFRSMRQDAEKETGPVWSTPGNDSRVTKIGRFLRRTRIDELPQIYNVLRGDMDIIGPRPERPVFVDRLSEEIPYYPLRHVVKPGISGWAQINYGYTNKLEHTIEKLQYDLFYIKNMSLVLDLMIVFETAKTVIVRKGS